MAISGGRDGLKATDVGNPLPLNFLCLSLIRVATVRETSGNFLKSQVKSLILSKSMKSEGILFSGL